MTDRGPFRYVFETQDNDAGPYTDPASVRDAVERLSTQMEEYARVVRRTTGWKRVEYATAVLGFIASGIVAFANPIALAGVFASVGQFVAASVSETGREGNGSISGASMFVTAQRELGWAKLAAR
jgi:preprotein translocase subunit Sss1